MNNELVRIWKAVVTYLRYYSGEGEKKDKRSQSG